MPTVSPISSHDERMLDAWNAYADLRQRAEAATGDPDLHPTQRMAAHKLAHDAYRTFMAVFAEPTPAELTAESAKLTCEGLLLVSLLAGFVGIFLPDLLINFWPLAITFVVCATLGGWAVHFLGRLGQHIGRRM